MPDFFFFNLLMLREKKEKRRSKHETNSAGLERYHEGERQTMC